MIDILLIAIFVTIFSLGGVYLGHFLTMKAISHIQPSTSEIVKAQKGNDQAEQLLDRWNTEEERSEVPDASTTSPREFVEAMEKVLKG